jgi:hypothetical protein
VTDGVNGMVLPEVTPPAIATAVRSLVEHPSRLSEFARQSHHRSEAGLAALASGLLQLVAG